MSNSLPLASVCDTDCLVSIRPLGLGRMPGKYVFGADAVLRRILYAWVLPRPTALVYSSLGCGLLSYQGRTLSPPQVLGLQGILTKAAKTEDYVSSARVAVELDSGTLSVAGSILLVDGREYSLEVTIAGAGAALAAFGGL